MRKGRAAGVAAAMRAPVAAARDATTAFAATTAPVAAAAADGCCARCARFCVPGAGARDRSQTGPDAVSLSTRFGSFRTRALLFVGAALVVLAAVVPIMVLSLHMRAVRGSIQGAGSFFPTISSATELNVLESDDVIGGSLRGEVMRFVHYGRADSAPSERMCVGDMCSAMSFLIVDQQTSGTDRMLDFLISAEPSVQELFAMLLASLGCPLLPTDSAGNQIRPWCAYDEAGTARTAPPQVIDVGANVGFYTLFSASAGARVVSIDPQPHCAHFVRAGVRLSGFGDQVRVVNAFAAAEDGGKGVAVRLRSGCWGTFPRPDKVSSENSHREFDALDGNQSVTVPAISLARLVRSLAAQAAGDEGVLIVKIDAEGIEDTLIAALDDAGVLKAGLVKNFIIEINSVAVLANYPDGACAADIKACYLRLFLRFKAAGYVLLSSASTTFIPVGDGDLVKLAQSVDEWLWMDLWWALPRAASAQ